MTKIIRKQSILLFVSLSIAYLICSQLISMEIRKRFAVQGILSKSLGMGYSLEINNIMDGNIKLVHSSSKYNTSMGKVSKIIEIENRYIGYLEEDGEIGDNHYFYISGISAEFELTEVEAKRKLERELSREDLLNFNTGQLIYEKSVEYLYKDGKIGYIRGDFNDLLKFFIKLMVVLTIIIMILLNTIKIIKNKIRHFFIFLQKYYKENKSFIKIVGIVSCSVFIILHIFGFLLAMNELKAGDYIWNRGMELNRHYYIEVQSDPDKKIEIGDIELYKKISENINDRRICDNITKMYKKGFYYIGYLKGGREEKECNNYFYINVLNDNDVKFELTEKNVLDKFKELNLKDPDYYILRYGTDGKEASMNRFYWSGIFFFSLKFLLIILAVTVFIIHFIIYVIEVRRKKKEKNNKNI